MRFLIALLFFMSAALHGQRSDFSHINFKRADSIALQYKGESLQNLPVLVHKLTSNLNTDVEKFRAIYTWVCSNIKNDFDAYQKTIKKRKKLFNNKTALNEWNANFSPKVFQNLLKHKRTSCTGYAYILRELARLASMECNIVNGYGRTPTLILDTHSIPNHSWNTVKLNDKWYLCDPTWSAGKIIIKEKGPKFEANYFDGYFLARPELFIKNHYPLETKESHLDNPPTYQEFINAPVVYKESFSPEMLLLSPSVMHLEKVVGEKVVFTLKIPQTLKNESISLLINNGSSSKTFQPKITRHKNNITFTHTLEKRGIYDVHIRRNAIIIATCVVRVKKS